MNPSNTRDLRRRFRKHLAAIHADPDWGHHHKSHVFFYFEPSALTAPPTYRAWNMAKLDVDDKGAGPAPPTGYANGKCTDAERAIENPFDFGLRYVDCATNLANINHSGWYTRHDNYGELAVGVVYLLPGKSHKARAVPGYIVDDDPTVVRFDFGDVRYIVPSEGDMDMREVALAADRMAEKAAESMREYDTAWQAGNQYAVQLGELRELHAEARAIVAEARRERTTDPTICKSLRSQFEDLREQIADIWKTCRELRAGDADEFCFYPNDETRAAFDEGAGCT